MREGAFSELGLQPWCHLLLEADRRPVRVAVLLDVRTMSLRYAGHLTVCIPYIIVHSLKSTRQRIGSQYSTIRHHQTHTYRQLLSGYTISSANWAKKSINLFTEHAVITQIQRALPNWWIWQDKLRYVLPTEETVKAMVAWGWTVELDSARAVSKAQIKRKVSKLALVSANVSYSHGKYIPAF